MSTKVIIEVSARHCHLTAKDLEKLFGRGYQLQVFKTLSEEKQFAAKETVDLKTKEGELKKLRIVGPIRNYTQVELSMTDARSLKIQPPLRLSGDIKSSLGGTLIGPKGKLILKEGIIIAQRHLHCSTGDAKKLKLTSKSIVKLKTPGPRSVVLENIPVRIDPQFVFRVHLDTDEGNASLPGGACSQGELVL